jgi:hypothetical protein
LPAAESYFSSWNDTKAHPQTRKWAEAFSSPRRRGSIKLTFQRSIIAPPVPAETKQLVKQIPHPGPAMSCVKRSRVAVCFLLKVFCFWPFRVGSRLKTFSWRWQGRQPLLFLLSVHGPIGDGTF